MICSFTILSKIYSYDFFFLVFASVHLIIYF